MSPFHYRHFIYLDDQEILNIAGMMEGREIDEELNTLTKGLGGNIGAKFGLTLGANLGVQKRRRGSCAEPRLRQLAKS